MKYDYHEDFVLMYLVAPVRERGLKLQNDGRTAWRASRSREGAWIEIAKAAQKQADTARSREGAWIEIL